VTWLPGAIATNIQGSPLTISGTLSLNNNVLNVYIPSGTPLGVNDYTLMTYKVSGSTGSFNSRPVITGAGLAWGTDGTVVTGSGTVKLHVVATTITSTNILSSSESPSGFGDLVLFTETVAPSGGTTLPTGTVQFKTNSVAVGSPVAVTPGAIPVGIASMTVGTLPRGTNLITAIYSGDSHYPPATNSIYQVVTNHPPVAAEMTLTRVANQNLKIPLTFLANNWTDADGDPIKLTAVNLLTTNGVALTPVNTITNGDGSFLITSAAYLDYPNNLTVNDRFSYSISDGLGGTNIGYVKIVSVSGLSDPTVDAYNCRMSFIF
jgi:hypothetical protein